VGEKSMESLRPTPELDGTEQATYTAELAAIPTSARRRVANLQQQNQAIPRALDFPFSGI
jgi:hypothetical protein